MAKKKIKKLDRHFCWFFISFAAVICLGIIIYASMRFSRESLQDFRAVEKYPFKISQTAQAWLEFDFGNGLKRTFVGNFDKAYSLVGVLDAATQNHKLSYKKYKGSIEKIDGFPGNWKIYHNHKLTGLPIENLFIKSGDEYLFRREK